MIEPVLSKFNLSRATLLLDMVCDLIFIMGVTVLRTLLILVGLVVVFVALFFTKKEGAVNANGWQMERLPSWAWLWSNDYDGVQGEKHGDYQRHYGFNTFWSKYNWTAVRNPVNNFSRYMIGFDYNRVMIIQWQGTSPDVDRSTKGFAYFRARVVGCDVEYPSFIWNNGKWYVRLGWKITRTRHPDRPWCGFTVSPSRFGH